MNSSLLVIRHCRAVLPSEIFENASIVVENGKIKAVLPGSTRVGPPGSEEMDLKGGIVAPGFIDTHCHGDGDAHFFENPKEVVSSLLRQGTTGVLATLGYPSMSPDGIGPQLRDFRRRMEEIPPGIVLGVHMEGPYTNPKYGAQTNRGVIKGFDQAEYSELLRDPLVRWWTCAPELPGAGEFIRLATGLGQVVAAGHTEATPEQTLAAVESGLKVITHWTNATGNARPTRFRGTREPGIDEAALVCDAVSAEILPDSLGCHVRPLMAKLLYRAKGADRILIITDAGYRRPDDPPADPAKFGDVSIDAAGDLAGSRLTMPKAAHNFKRFTGCTLPELFRMAALNAARLLNLDHLVGSIEPGKKANLVVLDDDFNVIATFVDGRRAFALDN